MAQPEVKKAPIFDSLEGWRFDVAGRTIDVAVDAERMRQDFVAEGKRRCLDEKTLHTLAGCFCLVIAESHPAGKKIGAQTEIHLFAPLDRSLFQVTFYTEGLAGGLSRIGDPCPRNENLGLIRATMRSSRICDSTTTDEVMGMSIAGALNACWKHEREHLLQSFTETDPGTKKSEERYNRTYRSIIAYAVALKAGLALLPAFADEALSGHFHVLTIALATIISIKAINTWEEYLHLLNLRARPDEIAAYEQMFGSKSLPGIFEVKVVKH